MMSSIVIFFIFILACIVFCLDIAHYDEVELTMMKDKEDEFSLMKAEGHHNAYMMWHMPPGCAVLKHFEKAYVAKSLSTPAEYRIT